jgi:hypothetical protein
MVYLQDADNAGRLFALDSGGVRRLSGARSRLLRRTAARDVSGHLGYIDDKPAAVYVAGGRLWFAINGQPWFLDELKAEIDQDDSGYAVRIETPNYDYKLVVCTTDTDDTTAFVDPEDRSFGLWVAQIVRNQERQRVLLETLVDAPLNEVPDHARTNGRGGSVDVRRSWTAPPPHASDLGPGRKRSTE